MSWPNVFANLTTIPLADLDANFNAAAALAGNAAQTFNVANATTATEAVALGQFEQMVRYTATFGSSYAPPNNTDNAYESVSITFPSFSKSGAFRVQARLVGKGSAAVSNAVNNMTNELHDGTNIFTGAAWLIYVPNSASTWGTSDTITTSATYAPGATVTFTHYISTAGGLASSLAVAGANMELYVVEA